MRGLNWKIILSNIAESREELEELEAKIKGKEKISEFDLQIALEHAYHHLNFAWNIRHVATKRYAKLTSVEFNQWSKFPEEIGAFRVDEEATPES